MATRELVSDEANIMAVIDREFEVTRGHPYPLGVSLDRGGVNFAVYSRHARFISLVIYLPGKKEPIAEFPLDARFNRTGDIWHVFIRGMDPGIEYGWRADGPSFEENPLLRFDRNRVLIDPHARALSSRAWGDRSILSRPCVVDQAFDWGLDQPLNRHLADSIIYELHVRGFTQDPSSGARFPGTFLGVIDKIPHLKELGVTAVELLPVTEFDENDNPRCDPTTGKPLSNFWGYHPINFFAPKSAYGTRRANDSHVTEFKEMVKALHEAGIEIILDMVFNHTAEGNELGPTLNFRGLDNEVYYILDSTTGSYHNYSGCGNTLNCNHPIVRDMILESLRYWVTEMHVDGFRFDLASILGRGRDGSVLSDPPLLERIAADPVLASTKLIAEAWDAAGLYQVGSFPNWGRWAEWNGKFRDHARAFVKGDSGQVPSIATRLCGSPDLYKWSERAPYHSINFITSHDGFTLNDLVCYNEKHNVANGEDNRDGDNHNLSWNCGEEGLTDNPKIQRLRVQQRKNLASLLLLSRGVPMILSGDEIGRTQRGNNNAYCQDSEISWIDWTYLERNADLFRFFKELIRFRMQHPTLRRRNFALPGEQDISWHGTSLNRPDWGLWSTTIAAHFHGLDEDDDVYLICNSHWDDLAFELPRLDKGRTWHRFVDTFLEAPRDIATAGKEEVLGAQKAYPAGARSTVVLVGK